MIDLENCDTLNTVYNFGIIARRQYISCKTLYIEVYINERNVANNGHDDSTKTRL